MSYKTCCICGKMAYPTGWHSNDENVTCGPACHHENRMHRQRQRRAKKWLQGVLDRGHLEAWKRVMFGWRGYVAKKIFTKDEAEKMLLDAQASLARLAMPVELNRHQNCTRDACAAAQASEPRRSVKASKKRS